MLGQAYRKRVVLVRHGDDPPDDRVHAFLAGHGFEPVTRKPFAGEGLDDLDDDIAGGVIYGGRFEAYASDRYPFLDDEARWIERCMKSGVPLLGICQGAQQIAHVLGAAVGPLDNGACEFGYYRIDPTEAGRTLFPRPLHVLESHFHSFGLPHGATHLAASELCPNQAFAYGETTYAFQFHAEQTAAGLRRWQEAPGARHGWPGAQTREQQTALMHRHDAAQAKWFNGFLARLFGHRGDAGPGADRPATSKTIGSDGLSEVLP